MVKEMKRTSIIGLCTVMILAISALSTTLIPLDTEDIKIRGKETGIRALEEGGEGTRAYTHTVLVEDFTATWCVYCPSVSEHLGTLYNSGDYNFYYVSLITDVNDEAMARADEVNIGSYPDVMMDGGFEEVVGAQSGPGPYAEAINASGERIVPSLTMEQEVLKTGNSSEIYVKLTVTNNEPAEYAGHVRSYITEVVSRYPDYDGKDYPFGLIGFAVDQDVTIGAGESLVITRSWKGGAHTDTNGDSYDDISLDNILVMSSVFNSAPNPKNHQGSLSPYIAYYVDATVATEVSDQTVDTTPPAVTIESPAENEIVAGSVEITAAADDNKGVTNALYRIDGGEWNDMDYYEGKWNAVWDSTRVEDGGHIVYVRARDEANNTATESVEVQVLNLPVVDNTPPAVDIRNPGSGEEVRDTVEIRAKVTDNVGVESVEYSVDTVTWNNMTAEGSGIYSAPWDSTETEDGGVTIQVRAFDASDNKGTDNVGVEVNNTGEEPEPEDTTPPDITITSPVQFQSVSSDDLEIAAQVTDEGDIASVDYAIDTNLVTGTMTLQAGYYKASVKLGVLAEGAHIITITAVDGAGNTAKEDRTFMYSPQTIVEPEFVSISHSPEVITASDYVDIEVEISGGEDVEKAYLILEVDREEEDPERMDRAGENDFEITVGPFLAGTQVEYRILLMLSDGTEVESGSNAFIVEEKEDEIQTQGIPGLTGIEVLLALSLVGLMLLLRKRK